MQYTYKLSFFKSSRHNNLEEVRGLCGQISKTIPIVSSLVGSHTFGSPKCFLLRIVTTDAIGLSTKIECPEWWLVFHITQLLIYRVMCSVTVTNPCCVHCN